MADTTERREKCKHFWSIPVVEGDSVQECLWCWQRKPIPYAQRQSTAIKKREYKRKRKVGKNG